MSSSDSPTLQWPNHREGSKISDPIRFEEMTDVKCPYCGSSNVSLLDAEGKELECNECGNKDVPARFSPDKEEGDDSEMTPYPKDTRCPNCGKILSFTWDDTYGEGFDAENWYCENCNFNASSWGDYFDKGLWEIDYEGDPTKKKEEEEGHYQTRPDPDNIHGCLCCDIGACQCTDCDECDPEWTGPKEEGGGRPPIDWENAKLTSPNGVFIEVPNLNEGGSDYYDESGKWVVWGVRNLTDEDIVDVLIKGEEGGGGYMGEGSGQGELGGIIKTREEATPYQAGGEDAELGQEDPDDSSTQLNPTTYQNQTSLGQGQSVPTSTVGLSKGEDIESCGVGCCSDIECGCGDCEYCDITLEGIKVKGEEDEESPYGPMFPTMQPSHSHSYGGDDDDDTTVNTTKCPKCGSTDIEIVDIPPTGAPDIGIPIEWRCKNCGYVLLSGGSRFNTDVPSKFKEEAEGHCDNCGGWGIDIRYSDLTNTMLCKDCRREARELDKINHSEEAKDTMACGYGCCDSVCECGDCIDCEHLEDENEMLEESIGDRVYDWLEPKIGPIEDRVYDWLEPKIGPIEDRVYNKIQDISEHRCSSKCCSLPCDCGDCRYCTPRKEEVKDPRIEPDEDAELSPEAQKIAGTDEASIEAKQSKKPKLEVEVSDKISILGKTGSGKTNLIKVLMTDIFPDYFFVVLDTIGNMAEFEGKENVEYHQVVPSDTNEVDDIIYGALERGDCMVVIDEVDRYQTKKGTMLNELVNVGRNYNVGGIFAARRTADVDKDILSNSPFIFVFQHILPQDLDVLIDWFAQPEQTFRDLQEYEAILFKNGEQIWTGKVPEKPTTKPTKKPNLPKKPKSKGKEPDKPTPKGGEPEGESKEKEPQPKEKEPEMEPEEPEEEPEPEPTHEFESKSEEPQSLPEKTEEAGDGKCPRCGGTMYQKMCVNCGFNLDELAHNMKQNFKQREKAIETGEPDPNDIHEENGSRAFREQALKQEGAFKCLYDNESFRYEKDFINHLNTHVR